MSELLVQSLSRTPCPNPKVIKNLCTALCSDADYTPVITALPPPVKGSKGSTTATTGKRGSLIHKEFENKTKQIYDHVSCRSKSGVFFYSREMLIQVAYISIYVRFKGLLSDYLYRNHIVICLFVPDSSQEVTSCNTFSGILTLNAQQKVSKFYNPHSE